MERIYRASVTVTLPRRHSSGRTVWIPAEADPNLLPADRWHMTELVRSPAECGPLVQRVGNIVGLRRFTDTPYLGFRVMARGVTTGVLCGFAEWSRRNRSESFEHVFTWHAEWSDCPPGAQESALFRLVSSA
jgi:hypothetical protein